MGAVALLQVTLHHQPRHKGDGPSDEGLVNNKAMNINHCVERIAKGPAWQIACAAHAQPCAAVS